MEGGIERAIPIETPWTYANFRRGFNKFLLVFALYYIEILLEIDYLTIVEMMNQIN